MRTALCSAFFVVVALIGTAHAAAIKPDNAWHMCQTDADCVLVEGPCKPTGVNLAYKTIAEEYYKKQPKKQCKSQFWSGKPNAVKCHLEACQAAYN